MWTPPTPEPVRFTGAGLDRAVRELVETVPTWTLPSTGHWQAVGDRLDDIVRAVERGDVDAVLDAVDRLWATCAPEMARTEVTSLVVAPADITSRLERIEAEVHRLRQWSRHSSSDEEAATPDVE